MFTTQGLAPTLEEQPNHCPSVLEPAPQFEIGGQIIVKVQCEAKDSKQPYTT